MSSIGHHLVRRAFDATQEHFQAVNSPQDGSLGQDTGEYHGMAAWGIGLLWATSILYFAVISAVSGSLPVVSPNVPEAD